MKTRKSLCRILWLFILHSLIHQGSAWEWSDLLIGEDPADLTTSVPLTLDEVSKLRVRDLKRQLARNHGYSADELAKMLDKKELIHALAFEEEKLRIHQEDKIKRILIKRGILTAIITIVVIMCWPLLLHAYEVGSINFVVYTDRKWYEATRCWELKSYVAIFGVGLMSVIEILQVWLTISIILSWVMRSKYFFPVPSISISPAQMMGGKISSTSLANYGLNIGPMIVGWLMRFTYARIEGWTGQALSKAHRVQRRAARECESEEEKAARKAARKAKKEARLREQLGRTMPESTLPPDWISAADEVRSRESYPTSEFAKETMAESLPVLSEPTKEPIVPDSKAHEEFLAQLDHNSELDDLD